MQQETVFIPVLLGTVRAGRNSEHAAKLIAARMEAHPKIETQLFDPRDMHLPMDDEGQTLKFKNPAYRNAIMRADGLVIVAPEYNHAFPGSLKRALDVLLTEYTHRAVGIAGVSAGGFGGTRVIEQLVGVVRELGLVVTSSDLNFSKVGQLFDDAGNFTDESMHERVDGFLEELVWMSQTLRWGRANLPSKYTEKLEKLQKEWEEKGDTT